FLPALFFTNLRRNAQRRFCFCKTAALKNAAPETTNNVLVRFFLIFTCYLYHILSVYQRIARKARCSSRVIQHATAAPRCSGAPATHSRLVETISLLAVRCLQKNAAAR